MEKIYSDLDIQEFLYQHGILWKGEVFKQSQTYMSLIPALVKLIDKNGEYEVYIQVSHSNFKIFTEDCNICYQETSYNYTLYKNLSAEWIRFLLNKYPYSATIISQSINNQKTRIVSYYKNEIEPLKKQIDIIKAKAKKELDYYNKLEKHTKIQETNASKN